MGVRAFYVKLAAASAAVISSSVALRLATPAVTEFLAAEAPRLYESVSAWLTPPYLYFVINGIIISIAATSRFQKPIPAADNLPFDPSLPPAVASYASPSATESISQVDDGVDLRPEHLAPATRAVDFAEQPLSAVDADREEGFVISRSSWSPRRRGLSEDLQEKPEPPSAGSEAATSEKPPVSARVGRRRSAKASPEAGKPLGVARPKKHDTLESTWRTITDGRPVPLARHLRKSDTMETLVRAAAADPAPPPPAMLKSETFAARSVAVAAQSPPTSGKLRREQSGGKLRREPSLGQDDLNRRVEAFIKKFNEEMRLQRQDSLQQYMDMMRRSGH